MTKNIHKLEKLLLREYWIKENILQDSRGYFKYASSLIIEDKIKNNPLQNKVVLDVGCGFGEQLLWFRRKGYKVRGIDLSHEVARVAHKKNIAVISADARALPFQDKSFDIVYSLGVLEHFYNIEKALEEQLRIIQPGGTIIVAIPYIWSPFALAITAFEVIRGVAFKYGFTATRGKLFSKKQLKSLLSKVGFENIEMELYYGLSFLRIFPFIIRNKRFISLIEKSILSKKLGLILYAQGIKKVV